jgi:hypothetical protein
MISGSRARAVWLAVVAATAVQGVASAAPPGPAALQGGKPSAPFPIDYRMSAAPRLGESIDLTITVRPPVAIDDFSLTLHPDDGLAVASGQGPFIFARVAPDAPAVLTVAVTSYELALLYVNVTVSGEVDGTLQSRSLLIPIRLGPKARSPAAKLAVGAGGELIRVMPARRGGGQRLR